VGFEVIGLGEGAVEGFAIGFDAGTFDGLALSLCAYDGLKLSNAESLGSLEVGNADGSSDGIGVKHEFLFSATHTCANCLLASMLITLTVTLLPDTVPVYLLPALNFATNSESA
jgi:hypothetical protein